MVGKGRTSSAANTSGLAFFKITRCSPLSLFPSNTPRNTVPKFPLPSAPLPISTRTFPGSTPGVRRKTFGACRFAALRLCARKRSVFP